MIRSLRLLVILPVVSVPMSEASELPMSVTTFRGITEFFDAD